MGRWGHDRDDDTDGKPDYTARNNRKHRVRVSVARDNASTARYEKTLSADEIKRKIKKLMFDNPRMRVNDLQRELRDSRIRISNITLSAIRTEYRDTVRFLRARGATGLPAHKGQCK